MGTPAGEDADAGADPGAPPSSPQPQPPLALPSPALPPLHSIWAHTRTGNSPFGASTASSAAAQYHPKSPRLPNGSRDASARMLVCQKSSGALKQRQQVARRTGPKLARAPSIASVRGWCGHICPSISKTPACRQLSSIMSASAADAASGFSHRTCRP
eukprot:scaffold613_cov152-Isochrysis_galbana.AAC.3